jgi:hypothetical protein
MPTWLDTRHGSSGSAMQLNLVTHRTNDATPLAAPTEATQLVLYCTRRGHDRQSNVAASAFHSLEQHLTLQLHTLPPTVYHTMLDPGLPCPRMELQTLPPAFQHTANQHECDCPFISDADNIVTIAH